LLLIESDGYPAEVEEEIAAMAEIARRNGATEVKIAASPEEAASLAAARRTAFSALARVGPTTILEDATVPRNRLPEMVRCIQEVGQRYRLKIGTFGHMGDGNLHPTFLTNETNQEEMHRVEEAMKEIFTRAVELGGTITGEHGVGLAKKSFLPGAVGELNVDLMRRVKEAFDPKGLLNPGKIFVPRK
jgi:glycolate oxidase